MATATSVSADGDTMPALRRSTAAKKNQKSIGQLAAQDVGPGLLYKVRNADPEKYYVWAPLETGGELAYETLGYEHVMWSEDPSAPGVGGAQGAPGTPIIRQAVTLMCIDASVRQAQELEGLRLIADRKRRISGRRNPFDVDESVTRNARHWSVTNQTEPETLESA
jgi:hypothetical protein